MRKYIDADKLWNRLISVSENDWVGFDTIDEVLSGMPAEPRWIPVTERLPEKVGYYPVTCLDGGRQIDLGQWCIDECGEGFWVCDWCDADSVIAWMPLPSPYKEGEEE